MTSAVILFLRSINLLVPQLTSSIAYPSPLTKLIAILNLMRSLSRQERVASIRPMTKTPIGQDLIVLSTIFSTFSMCRRMATFAASASLRLIATKIRARKLGLLFKHRRIPLTWR